VLDGHFVTALHAAISGKDFEIVQLLLENGADSNVQGKFLFSRVRNRPLKHIRGGEYGNALQAALYIKHFDIFKLLLENGADPNAQGKLLVFSYQE
jgi:ankyrin repeat protein